MRAIVFQQLAGRAAQAIYGRVRAAVGETLTPEAVNAVSGETLRAAGLSGNKLASLRDLSAKVLDGTVILSRTSRRSDEELIERLTTVRGIGRWTAEMYLMFQLRRLDVWPVDDLGVRQGYALAWNVDPAPTPKQLRRASRPNRRALVRESVGARPNAERGRSCRTRARIPRLARALPIRADVVDNFDLNERKFRSRAMTRKACTGFG